MSYTIQLDADELRHVLSVLHIDRRVAESKLRKREDARTRRRLQRDMEVAWRLREARREATQ